MRLKRNSYRIIKIFTIMNCNQPFYGNGFNNAQYYGYIPPNIIPQNLSPQIVGEGEVASVTLPDGTFQWYFIPTVKWWTPSTPSNYPFYTNMVYTNNTPVCGPNIGAWLIRTICNPRTYPTTNSQDDDCFYNDGNQKVFNGNQVKFHNDNSSSTTDIHYFIPCTKQVDCSITLPAKGCAAVQVDTPNNMFCQYEAICSKPCHCKFEQSQEKVPSKSSSAMSLVKTSNCSICEEMKAETICKCNPPKKKIKNKKTSAINLIQANCGSNIKEKPKKYIKQELKLIPSDPKQRRILQSKDKKSKKGYCECHLKPCKGKSAASVCKCSYSCSDFEVEIEDKCCQE